MASDPSLHGALDALGPCHSHTQSLQRCCEQEESPDGDLMFQAEILEFSMWLKPADEADTALSAADWCSLLIQ